MTEEPPPKLARRRPKALGWLLALSSAFVTALVTGLAGKAVDVVFPSTPSPSTLPVVRLLRPFDTAGNLLTPYKAVRHTTGKCQRGYESSDPESLRCFSTDSEVFDPCWEQGSSVACLQNPWTPDATVFDHPQVERQAVNALGPTPWALELSDPGQPRHVLRCSFTGGATSTVAGMRVNWGCFMGDGQPSAKNYVGDAVGDPRTSTDKQWTVFYAPRGSSVLQEALIRTVDEVRQEAAESGNRVHEQPRRFSAKLHPWGAVARSASTRL